MTQQKIAELMNMPFEKLYEAVQTDVNMFATILSLAVNLGIKLERERIMASYNKSLRGEN